jgi:hypothetical protein
MTVGEVELIKIRFCSAYSASERTPESLSFASLSMASNLSI